jgi:hypothetical protein
MSESEKPEGDFSDSDAITAGEDGEPCARMEALQKSGNDDSGADSADESD